MVSCSPPASSRPAIVRRDHVAGAIGTTRTGVATVTRCLDATENSVFFWMRSAGLSPTLDAGNGMDHATKTVTASSAPCASDSRRCAHIASSSRTSPASSCPTKMNSVTGATTHRASTRMTCSSVPRPTMWRIWFPKVGTGCMGDQHVRTAMMSLLRAPRSPSFEMASVVKKLVSSALVPEVVSTCGVDVRLPR